MQQKHIWLLFASDSSAELTALPNSLAEWGRFAAGKGKERGEKRKGGEDKETEKRWSLTVFGTDVQDSNSVYFLVFLLFISTVITSPRYREGCIVSVVIGVLVCLSVCVCTPAYLRNRMPVLHKRC